MSDRPGARATYYYACAIRTKWRLIHPETPVELSVSLFDSLVEFIRSKGSSSVGYRLDWCINYRLQSNQFVGSRDEEEKKTCITIAVYFRECRWVENHSQTTIIYLKRF